MNFEITKSKVVTAVETALGNLEALTKRLKVMAVSKSSDKRKVVVSSKDLKVSGLPEGAKIVVEAIKGIGIRVRPAMPGDTKVRTMSSRIYPNREGVEPVLDLRHQKDLNDAIGDAKHVHVIFKKDQILIQPVYTHEQQAKDTAKGLSININQKDENGLYSGIIEALNVIKAKKFAHVTIEADQEFRDSHEFTLFSIQLRRLGYNISPNDMNQLVAELKGVDKPDDIEQITVNPPVAVNAMNQQVINSTFDNKDPLSAFTVCTAGVDISALEADGFSNHMALDWRPHEKRDFKKSICKETGEVKVTLTDKSDTGAISAAINGRNIKVLFNENIYEFDVDTVKGLFKPFNFLHLSLQCDDFSCLKNKKDRQKAIETLDTTTDMIFEALEMIEKSKVPTLMIENVRNFSNSIEAQLFETRLRALGYNVHKEVLTATDFDGMTNRQRCYLFASTLTSPFAFPEPVKQTRHAWNDVIEPNLDQLRDVSHCKSVVKGVETGRIRTIKPGDAKAPTITKSQSRQTKDSFYVEIDGKFFMPTNEMLMKLMGFMEGFDISAFSSELATEIIGQSIEVPMHRKICQSVKQHISDYMDGIKTVTGKAINDFSFVAKSVVRPIVEPAYTQGEQMSLAF